MEAHFYEIQMKTEIGIRTGRMMLERAMDGAEDEARTADRTGNRASGWLELLSGKVLIAGEWVSRNSCQIAGIMKSLNQQIPFEALCLIESEKIEMTLKMKNKEFSVVGKEICHEEEK